MPGESQGGPQQLIFFIDRETITNQTGRAPTVHHSSHLRELRERWPIQRSVQRENLQAQGMKRQSGFSTALQRRTLFGNRCLSSPDFLAPWGNLSNSSTTNP